MAGHPHTDYVPLRSQTRAARQVPEEFRHLLNEDRYESIHEAARMFHSLGFCCVPIIPGSKFTPKGFLWRDYNSLERRTSEEDIDTWFHPETGTYRGFSIGQISGLPSGVVCVDCDTVEAAQWCDANLPPTPLRVASGRSPEAASNGIGHRFYRWDEKAIQGWAYEDSKRPGKAWLKSANGVHLPPADGRPHVEIGLDLKADGSLTVLPGAIHKSGRLYQLADGAQFVHTSELPAFDPSLMEKVLCGCGVRNSKKGCRGGGIWSERKRREDERPSSERELLRRSEKRILSGGSPIKVTPQQYRVALDLAATQLGRTPAVESGRRDATAFRLAATLIRDFAISQVDAYKLLSAWNRRCPAPLAECVLDEKLRSAYRSGRNPFGKQLYALGVISAEEYGLREGEDRSRPQAPTWLREEAPDALAREGLEQRDQATPIVDKAESYTQREKAQLYEFGTCRFEDYDQEWRRVSRVASCGRAMIGMACSENSAHGDIGIRHVVCEVDKACPYCASRRAMVIAKEIAENWSGGRVAVLIADVSHIRHDLSWDPAAAHAAVRREVRKALPKKGCTYRWVCGHASQVWVVPADERGVFDNLPESIRRRSQIVDNLSSEQVSAIVRKIWTEPAYHLLSLVRAGAWQIALECPYLSPLDTRFPRSRASRSGVAQFPWPSLVSIREELSKEAQEKRGGVDHRHCATVLEDGTRCCAPRTATVFDRLTGQVLFEEQSPDVPLWRTHQKARSCVTALVAQERFGLSHHQLE